MLCLETQIRMNSTVKNVYINIATVCIMVKATFSNWSIRTYFPVTVFFCDDGFSFITLSISLSLSLVTSCCYGLSLFSLLSLSVPPQYLCLRWSGFLFCAVAMLLVIFPMFAFPKKLPPRHKKSSRKKQRVGDLPSDDEVMKEKSQAISSSIGFGKDIKGKASSGGAMLGVVYYAVGFGCFFFVTRG